MTTWEHKFFPCIMFACRHVLLYDYWLFFMSKGDKIKDLSVEHDEGVRLRRNTQSCIIRPLCSNTKWFEDYNLGVFWPKKVTNHKPKLTFFTMTEFHYWNFSEHSENIRLMDYVRDGEIQGSSFVFLKLHCPCILPSLT